MLWLLNILSASTRLRQSPFTETAIAGVHSAVYRPGVEPLPQSGADAGEGLPGTFRRGLHRVSGVLFTYDGSAAESLLGIEAGVDLILRYNAANGQKRRRTFRDVIFAGDSVVTLPSLNTGLPQLIGVPFRVQIPFDQTLADHVEDTVEP